MIPHVQDDKRQRGEQPLSPGWFRGMLAPTRWWRNTLFVRVSGAVLLILGGLSPLFAPATWDPLITGFFVGVAGAVWVESWWACLIAPLAFGAGYTIGQLQGNGFDVIGLVVLLVAVSLGAALCTAFFERSDLWHRVRGKSR